MSDEMPQGWHAGQVSDIAVVNPPGSTVATSDEALVSFLPMAAVTELTGYIDLSIKKPFGEVKKGFTRFKNGDVLFAKITPSMENGKIAVARDLEGGLGCGTTEFHVVRPEHGIEADYLRYYFVRSAYRQEARRNMQGAVGQQRVPPDFIRESDIPVAPSGEQKRIVSRIDELFSSIDEGERALERVQKLLERYRQSILKAAVTGELTREWRERNKDKLESGEAMLARILKARREAWEKAELDKMNAKGITPANDKWKQNYEQPSSPDTTDLPELPEGWTWTSLEQVTTRVTDGTHQPPPFSPAGIPFLTIQHLSPGAVHWEDVAKWVTPETFAEHTKSMRPRRGDVLYSAVGSYGIAAAVKVDFEFMFQRHIAHIRPLLASLSPDYLELVLNSPGTMAIAHEVARGVAQKTVTLGDLREFPVPMPSTLEQKQVLEALAVEQSRLSDVARAFSGSINASLALRQGVLKSAFSGRLVNRDPADEPASTLLECIVAARDAEAATSKRGRKKTNA